VAAGVAVPIAVLAVAGTPAVVLDLVIRRWRYRLTPPPAAPALPCTTTHPFPFNI
jgi:hypothetical protein